tara:strand:+ start:234 stop:1427 length:1194 start_codon:yes stop_codon:yes gene_type:complete
MEKLSKIELKIPNLGEAESTEIIEINIKSGDKVKVNDPLIVLESEKAAMEVPSDYEGTISEVSVREGESVKEGMLFAKIEVRENNSVEKEINKPIKQEINKPIKQDRVKTQDHLNTEKVIIKGINAGPAVRKYARELEIDLTRITGTGKNHRITKEDLKNYIHAPKKDTLELKTFSESDFLDEGSYSIQKMSKIRVLGAKNVQAAWNSIPHVTHFDEIDMSNINKLKKEINLNPLVFMVKALTQALKEFPIFNSSLIENDQLVLKEYINVGIAVDTEEGLVVPVIQDADKLSLDQISIKIKELAEKARNKKLLNTDLANRTISISSLGKLGGIGFTPIINPPDVAIISMSKTFKRLVLAEELDILPIAMSYDHRVINGADAGRFMVFLKDILDNFND